MNYRPDVDGLRAIAIFFVLVFHSGLTLFPSGFIGVDIFFVISGFLINHIIHNSIENNHFSFVEFYNRRLWRLQPVFICLLVVVSLFTLIFYLPDDLVQYAKSARKTSLFSANHYFARVTTDYFAPNNHQLPLLHTWSLAIEWQCYFMLPLAIFLLNRLAKQQLSQLIYLLTLLFFALSLYLSHHDAVKTYYLFLSRIFEFLIGACVALSPKRFSLSRTNINLITGAAFVTLFYVATRTNISGGFPNYYALALCMATGIIIAAGNHTPVPLVNQLLATKPFVCVGLISYSLYIWHWPIFAFIRYENIQETYWVIFLALSSSFLLAYLSWRYIEKPARKFNRLDFRYSVVGLLILPVVMIHLSGYLIHKNGGFPGRFSEEVVQIYKQLNQYESKQRPLCIGKNNIDINTHCMLGAKNPDSKRGLMIGDSYSNHYWGFMDTMAKDANLSILAQATSSCLTLPGIFLYDWWSFKNKIYQDCSTQTTRYFNMIKANHYDFVIIGQTWKNYLGHNIITHLHEQSSPELTKQRVTLALDKALQIIIESGAKPVLIKATASTTENLHDCFFQHIKQRKAYHPDQCDFTLQANAEIWLNDLFIEMQKKYPQLIIIDPQKVQCVNGRCKADINGIPVFRDIGHITDYASYQFAKLYLQQYKNPLIN